MANQGIQLPVQLQISNLQEVANQIKQFANKNVLADSLGGKKIDSELSKILSRLDQISAKSKTAFTTQADFTSVEKDISQVELSLNKVQNTIKGLGFEDLKIPSEFEGQIQALQSRIKELNGSLTTFKGTQKQKLISNADFVADLTAADPTRAAKMLEKGYDELFKAVNTGMARVNAELTVRVADFKRQQEILTQNSDKRASMTQWGALNFLQEAFKKLPTDSSKQSDQQKLMSDFMNSAMNESGNAMDFTTFKNGNAGYSAFLKKLREKFEFTPQQISEIRARIKEQATSLKKSVSEVVSEMGNDTGFAKKMLFGDSASTIAAQAEEYRKQQEKVQKALAAQNDASARQASYQKVALAFDIPNQEIKAKSEEIAAALQVPTEALRGFETQILSAATKSPQLAAIFQRASGEIATLTNTVENGKQKLQSIDNAINKMQGISNFINRYVGLYAIVRKVTTAIRNAFNNIKELDKAITGIAVVTNMSQSDLWSKIGEYTQMAQQYGVATKDVYTVSQIFYQQGLQTSQVMQMTTESLKMAKIAGIDYSTAANAMTVAVRAFKLEMSEAQSVTDTYSALAAKFAVSSAEIANAMEKTASSAANVGMSVQSTSAFISVMEQTTRESAQNIGSALKSIISRYGEMKASPDKLLNVDGEEVAFNKVDTALASIGISIKDASGQFRDFDDVIMELAKKWDTLDNNTQRYIATIMAGNRQQSRFIALVSNYDELSRAMDTANNAENASIVQVAKTMDSLESKANQLKNAFSQIYLDLHAEEGLKRMYDWLTRILKTIGKLGMLKGVLPTLMNVIGFGTGTKKLVRGGMDWLQSKKNKLIVDTDEAQKKIDDIRAKASQDIVTKVRYEADLSQLQTAQNVTQTNAMTAASSLMGYFKGVNPTLTTSTAYNALSTAYKNGDLSDPTKRANFMQSMGIDPNSDKGNQVDALLQSFTTLKQQADQLGITLGNIKASGDDASNKLGQVGQSGQQASTDLNKLSIDVQNTSNAENNKGNAAVQAAQEDLNKATAAKQAAYEDVQKAIAEQKASTAIDTETQTRLNDAVQSRAITYANTIAKEREAQASYNNALAKQQDVGATEQEKAARQTNTGEITRNTGAFSGNTDQKLRGGGLGTGSGAGGWAGHETGMKVTGVATGIARIAGTAITAAGAAHEDKSTEPVETSKILTGLGNGLSMAGTGASMGMAFGPWGAAIGAIGGFLLGGLGAIIDGATMTLEERLALEKEEAKKAAEESLKAQAKTTDLSGQIDNIKQLQKAMYNSKEDMQAYKDAMTNMASQYPTLINTYDEAGNAIIDLNKAEALLAETRLDASIAANQAAKAEAKTRQTAIETLEVAKQKTANAYNGFNHITLKNREGILQTLDTTGSISQEELTWLFSEAQKLGYTKETNKDNLTADDYKNWIEIMNREGSYTSSSEFQILKSFFKNYDSELGAFNEATEVTFSDELANQLLNVNDTLKNRAEELHLVPNDDVLENVDENLVYIYTLADWSSDVEITGERLKEFEEKLDAKVSNYKEIVAVLDESLPAADARESLDYALLDKDAEKSTKISSSKVTSQLIANALELESKKYKEVSSAGEWSRSKDEELIDAYNNAKNQATDTVVTWLISMTGETLDKTLNILDSMTEYLSVEDMLAKLGYSSREDFISRSGLNKEQSEQLLNSWEQSFIDANEENRNRILSTVYKTDENGEQSFNTEALNSINKLHTNKHTGFDIKSGSHKLQTGIGAAEEIANMFKADESGSSQIVSKYANYFTSQLLAINDLAENGYTELASTRLNALTLFSNSLSQMSREMQNAMFGIITNIDFSSYDSIQSAIENMEDYAKKNNITDIVNDEKLGSLYNALVQVAQNLLFNVTTLAQEITTTITNASSKIDSIISTNKSGLSFDKALEEFTDLQAQFSELTNFDQIFSYDAILGKYVYNQDGLKKAIQAQEEKLNDQVIQLSNTAKIYTEQITQNGKVTSDLDDLIGEYNEPEELYEDVLALTSITDPQIKAAYEKLSKEYIDSLEEGQQATGEGFREYIEQQAQEISQQAADAQILVNEYQANKKNQYYQAIDWSKLALGTDYSGTNKFLVRSLAESIYTENQIGENGEIVKVIKDKYGEGKDFEDWETVLNDYLDETYGSIETINEIANEETRKQALLARQAAETAIKGEIKSGQAQQSATAITQILSENWEHLSADTIALLSNMDIQVFETDENGNLTENIRTNLNSIKTALQIYWNTTFDSIEQANNNYAAIITQVYNKNNIGKSLLSSGGKMDLDTLKSSFTSLGLELDDYFVQNEDGTFDWSEDFDDVLETDAFGQTVIKDWDELKNVLIKYGVDLENASQEELAKWHRASVDAQISDLDALDVGKAAASELSSLGSAKVGTRVNIQALKDSGALSEELIQKLDADGDGIYEVISETERDNLIMAVDMATIADEEVKRQLEELQKNIKKKRNKFNGVKGITSERVSSDTAKALVQASDYDGTEEEITAYMRDTMHYVYNAYTDEWVATTESIQPLKDRLEELRNVTDGQDHTQEINELEASINDLEYTLDLGKKNNAVSDILNNYNSATGTQIAALKTAFKDNTDINWEEIIQKNDDGTFNINVDQLTKELEKTGYAYTDATDQIISSIADTYVENINSAMGFAINGTTSQVDMSKFATQMHNLYLQGYIEGDMDDPSKSFYFDQLTKTFRLSNEAYTMYITAERERLMNLKYSEEQIDAILLKSAAEQVDIEGFLSATDISEGSIARTNLEEQLKNWYATKNPGQKISDEQLKTYINQIEAGGRSAVTFMKELAADEGRELSTNEIESAFSYAFNELNDAMDSLADLTIGQITSGKLRKYLEDAHMVDADGVVDSVEGMVDVYSAIYKEMTETAGATRAGLNEAYAKVLTARDQERIDTLDALENASGMTYDALGAILTTYTKETLEEFMGNPSKYGVETTGFGKVRIIDWDAFATKVFGKNYASLSNTSEYMEAYNSYVEARVELENQEKENIDEAIEEIKSIEPAKAGGAINVAHLSAVMGDKLDEVVAAYADQGVQLVDGMLTINSSTNVPQLIMDIRNKLTEVEGVLPEQIAELNDAIIEYFSNLTSLIQNGIKGSLKNVDAVELQNWATSLGVGELNFTRTAEGLKLSEQSAIALYSALKKVDGLQAKLVFDDLRESLEKTNDQFKDTQSLLEHVNKIRNHIYEADGKTSKARLRQYEAELQVAEDILAARATSEDDSYKFMDKAIPAGQNNPLNYVESWQKAYEAMKKTRTGGKNQKGLMEYTDFYNIITEMGHLAEYVGTEGISLGKKTLHNAEEASALITEAAGKLKVTSDGKMKVDLSDLGVEFLTGADKLSSDVDKGIEGIAQAQMDMLDSLISLLEVVVAMEKLGDIDLNGDNHINLDEIFEVNGSGKPIYDAEEKTYKLKNSYQKVCQNIIDMANDNRGENDLNKALNAVRINGVTMKKIFEDGAKGVMNANFSYQEYQKTIDAFYQMAMSDDYDLDNIAESVQKIFADSGLKNVAIDVGTKTFYLDGDFRYLIDWNNEDAIKKAKEELKAHFPELIEGLNLNNDDDMKTAIDRLIKERNKENLSIEDKTEIDYTLGVASGAIQISEKRNEKGKYTGTYKGVTFSNESKDQVVEKIKQAIRYEENGFIFHFDDDTGEVTGTIAIGNAKINVQKNADGQDEYTPTLSNGQRGPTTTDYQEAINWLVKNGEGSKGTHIIDGEAYNVFVDKDTNISYTLNPDNTYSCEGHDFKTWEALQNYLAYKRLTKGGEVIKSTNGIEITVNGNARAKYYFKSGHTKYEFKGPDGEYHEFASQADYEQYLQAYEFSGGHINNDTGNLQYELDGIPVELVVEPGEDGKYHVKYTFTLPDGTPVSSETEDGIKLAIADYSYLTGGEITPGEEKSGVSYTVGEGETAIIVTYDAGKVTVTDKDGNATKEELQKQLNDAAQAKVNEVTPEATADKVNIDATTATITPTLPEKIELPNTPPLNIIASNVKVSLANDTVPDVKDVATKIVEALQEALNNMPITPNIQIPPTNGNGNNGDNGRNTNSKDNVSVAPLAKGNVSKNSALASGTTSTLMGELGPELVVSNGRYFVVGQSGAEFVDLDKDAIVFNHKQTEQLLSSGSIGSRGAPFTNEINAISYAKGNTASAAKGLYGPAMASASAALAALKQLRAMWESLFKASAQDLSALGGSSGGGGKKTSNFIKQLERWYNWLQKIATLEEKINYQEKLRNKINSDFDKNGTAYYNSQRKTLKYLESELATTKNLLAAQKEYFNVRRNELNSDKNPFNSLYYFDSNGQLKYKNGKFEELSKMSGTNKYGTPNMSAKQQYEYITGTLGIDSRYLQYDTSGTQIEFANGKPKDDAAYQAAVQAFWDKIEADRQEMQSLHDSIDGYEEKLLELQKQQNEILKEMQDNQIELQNAVLSAMEENSQRTIDELSDLKDNYSETASKLIDGLSNALNKEKEAYDRSNNEQDLLQLRRRLALLQRSGGSASEIASLQDEITSKSRDLYFNKQQNAIDELQEASDAQIERLDKQIELMTQTLEYQKKYGLLWGKVADIMNGSPQSIASYIQTNTESMWGKSPLESLQEADNWLFKADQWIGFRTDSQSVTSTVGSILNRLTDQDNALNSLKADFGINMTSAYGSKWTNLDNNTKAVAQEAFEKAYKESGDYNIALAAGQAEVQKYYNWKEAEKEYSKKYGVAWDYLSDETKASLKTAVQAGDQTKVDSIIKEATANEGLFEASEQAKKQFKVEYNKETGKYRIVQTAVNSKDAVNYKTAYKNMIASQKRLDSWNAMKKQIAATYGDTWTNLDDSRKTAIKEKFYKLYDADPSKAANIKLSDVVKGQTNALGTSKQQNESKWIYKKNETSGLYEAIRVSSDYTGTDAKTYAEALYKADWQNFKLQYGNSWNMLTDQEKSSFASIYKKAYNAATKNKADAGAKALKADSTFKAKLNTVLFTADEREKKQWSIKQKTDKSWMLAKARKTTKTPGTYDQAYKAMNANNKLWDAWMKKKAENKKKGKTAPAEPTYNVKYKYDKGGMVETTGLALLHAKEGVLTSQQTDVLRNQILGSQKDSLINLLIDFKKAYSNISTQGFETQPSINIENASVNMNVGSIANDYDARRAGEQALAEMLRIARKNGTSNSIRR